MIKREKLARHPRTMWQIWVCDVMPTSRIHSSRASRPNWIPGLAQNLGSAGIWWSQWPKNGVARWRWLNSEIYSQNDYINILAWRQIIISLACFANNVIHPWPQEMPIFDQAMPPGFSPQPPAICFCHNFVYISTLENWTDKSVWQNFHNIVPDSLANFQEKLS